MPNLNIEINDELRRAMAHYCIDNNLSQKEFVTDTLIAALSPRYMTRLHLSEIASYDDPSGITQKHGVPSQTLEQEISAAAIAAMDTLTHGPSGTCKVYRCGQCIALGKKF